MDNVVNTAKEERSTRKERIGIVVSSKGDKTAVIETESLKQHRVYKKFMRRRQKYHAHDENNQCHVGDRVRIVECRPLSKQKRWRVREILERAK